MAKKTVDLKDTKWIAEFRLNSPKNARPSVDCPPMRAVAQSHKTESWKGPSWHKVKEDGTVLGKSYLNWNVQIFDDEKQAWKYYNSRISQAINRKRKFIEEAKEVLERFEETYLPKQ